jgi:hypothetical protein
MLVVQQFDHSTTGKDTSWSIPEYSVHARVLRTVQLLLFQLPCVDVGTGCRSS